MARKRTSIDTVEAFEKAAKARQRGKPQKYKLRLYVAGVASRSSRAIKSITRICEAHLQGRYELEIIDIYKRPELAKGEQIIAAPTLVKKLPLPLRRLVGDMAEEKRVLVGLDLILRESSGKSEK